MKDVADKKKDDGLFSFLKRKIKRDTASSLKNAKPEADIEEFQNLSQEQKEFQTMLNNNNVFKLLEEQIELSSKL